MLLRACCYIIDWFKAIVKGIISFFTSKKIDRVIEALKKSRDEGRVKELDVRSWIFYIDPDDIYEMIESFKEIIDKISESADSAAVKSEVEELAKKLENYIKEGKKYRKEHMFDSSDTTKWGLNEIINTLEEIQRRGPAKNGKELLKKLGYKPKDAKTANGNAVDKDTNKAIKKLAGQLAKAYDKYCNATVRLVDKALGKAESETALRELQAQNDARKAEAKSRSDKNLGFEKPETESYYSNTDGYYFL